MDTVIFGIAVGDLLHRAFIFVVALAITLAVQHVVVKAARKALDASNVPSATIFINIVRAVIWSFAVLAVLEPVFRIQPTMFVTALGVTSVVISFGLQDTVSNVIAGLGLMMGKVVKPGDQVTIGDVSGVVTDVTWRSSMVRDRGGKVQVIPNAVLNKTALTRRTRWDVTCVKVPLVVDLDADLDNVAREIKAIAFVTLAGRLDPDFMVEVRFLALRPYGVDCEVVLHVTDEQVPVVCADKLVRVLAGKDWLAHGTVTTTN